MVTKITNQLRHRYYGIFKVLVFIAVAAIVLALMPRSVKFKYDFQQAKPWLHSKLIAPFDFPVLKTEEQLQRERKQASENIQPYFSFDEVLTANGIEQLVKSFNEAWARKYQDGGLRNRQETLGFLLNIYDSIQEIGILRQHPVLENKAAEYQINVVRNRTSQPTPLNKLFTIGKAYETALQLFATENKLDTELLSELAGSVFVQNLIYDDVLTRQETDLALSRISETHGMVQQGELIINEGELVDESRYNILNSLKREYQNLTGTSRQQNLILLGQALLIAIIFLILYLFIQYVRPDVFAELKKINLVLLLILIITVPSLLLLQNESRLLWMIPFGLLPIIMITFFDTRLTLMVHILTVLLVALAVPKAFDFIFLQLAVGYVVIFTLMRHNRRIFFFRTSLLLFLSYSLVYTGLVLMSQGSFMELQTGMFVNFAISAALTLFALPLIFMLEKLFGLITDLSLLELSNTNSPLLRSLAMTAPGTFQHSMQVANLSEEALYEIGGDTLLARTGALYHDIGKMDNPIYFIENQMGGYNPHNDISPAESASIIIDHVTRGIEKARKAGLPEQIIDFIRTHHGNSRVEYFYIMEQRENPGQELDERDFSYRGPIPFSKETAVVMMADSVEAASRSLKNPTEQKISDLVENIINKQIERRQFLNTDITLKEIDTVKRILKKKLMNIYHVRIAYPD